MQLRYRLDREHLEVPPAGLHAAAAFLNQILYGLSIDAGIVGPGLTSHPVLNTNLYTLFVEVADACEPS
jgi:hypothetical protein